MMGVIVAVSRVNGFVAIRTSSGEYTVAELLGAEVAIGDEVSGELESLGGETLVVLSSRTRISVYIQDIHATAEGAKRLLALQ
jgi:hypothetical protein